MSFRKAILWAMIGSFASAAAVGVLAMLTTFGLLQERLLVSTLTIGLMSLPAMASASVMERGRFVWLMRAGLALALVSTAAWLGITWSNVQFTAWMQNAVHVTGMATTVACAIPWCGLLGAARLRSSGARVVRALTIGMVCVTAALILGWIVMWWVGIYADEWYARGMGVAAILGVAGTLITPLMARLERASVAERSETTIPSKVMVKVICPRCDGGQELRSGDEAGACAACGLGIRVVVEEPRCECGYLLYGLKEPVCPECGKRV